MADRVSRSFTSDDPSSRVLTTYQDGLGLTRTPPAAAIAALQRSLRPRADDPADTAATPPIIITRGTRSIPLPAARTRPTAATLTLECGATLEPEVTRSRSQTRITAPEPIPLGVHTLTLEHRSRPPQRLFILAQPDTLRTTIDAAPRRLALFIPLYALTPPGPFNIATYTDLRTLAQWADQFDHALVGTLPLFPTFLSEPFDPSPYAPITRLMWSELFIDPLKAPEAAALPARAPRASTHVDYRASWSAARAALKAMSASARSSPARWSQILARCSAQTVRYAQFRAATDAAAAARKRGTQHAHRLTAKDLANANPADTDLYLYAQSIANQQMTALARSRAGISPLYLDLPVGVHPRGFDAFARPDLFLTSAEAGAPPDDLNPRGQSWGFAPLHPTAGRADGYAYLRAVLRQMLSVAGVLRIDHVMGLYRMFCIPRGYSAADGAYVRYPEEELFAIVMIEAARANAIVVGEDLGTVPPDVRRIMQRCGILGMHVQQFALDGDDPNLAASRDTLASLNTHDTPTFAGFWHGDDITLREKLGIQPADAAESEHAQRTRLRASTKARLKKLKFPAASAKQVALSLMRLHARGEAPITLINLEDLWAERRPHNVPGTSTEHPNWQRRASRPLTRITRDRAINTALSTLTSDRRDTSKPSAKPRTKARSKKKR